MPTNVAPNGTTQEKSSGSGVAFSATMLPQSNDVGQVQNAMNDMLDKVNQVAKVPDPIILKVRNSTSTVASGNYVLWNLVDVDTASGYSTTTGLYTIKTPGYYFIGFELLCPNAPTGEYRYGIYVNKANSYTAITYKSTASVWQTIGGTTVLKLSADDKIGIYYASGTGNTYTDPGFDTFHLYLIR